MRARAVIGSVIASVGILAGGWEIGAGLAGTTVASTPSAGTGDTSTPSTGTTSTESPSSTSTATDADGTWTGASVDTRFGPVQVQVTIAGGAITDVSAIHLTDHDGKSIQISNRAAPLLRDEVLAAQSADVRIISGATYTSQAYLSSLQSALDQAGF